MDLQIFERLPLCPVIGIVLEVAEPLPLILPINILGRFHSGYFSRTLKIWEVESGSGGKERGHSKFPGAWQSGPFLDTLSLAEEKNGDILNFPARGSPAPSSTPYPCPLLNRRRWLRSRLAHKVANLMQEYISRPASYTHSAFSFDDISPCGYAHRKTRVAPKRIRLHLYEQIRCRPQRAYIFHDGTFCIG